MKHLLIAISIMILGLQGFAQSGTDKDNTKVNKRDRNTNELTAGQQANNSSDIELTRRIREEIMEGKNFSTYAQNVKIITVGGKVTLKGPVQSEQEINSIVKFASQVAGATNVKNEMSVVTEKN